MSNFTTYEPAGGCCCFDCIAAREAAGPEPEDTPSRLLTAESGRLMHEDTPEDVAIRSRLRLRPDVRAAYGDWLHAVSRVECWHHTGRRLAAQACDNIQRICKGKQDGRASSVY